MKSNLLLIYITLFLSIPITYGSQAISISTTLSGGIQGVESSIRPNIEFESSQSIFDGIEITSNDVGKEFFIYSNHDDPDFADFVQKLTDGHDDVMKVGHTIGYIKGNLGNYETTWFNETNLFGKNIERISIRYECIEFADPVYKNHDYWTDFDYEVTITFYVAPSRYPVIPFIFGKKTKQTTSDKWPSSPKKNSSKKYQMQLKIIREEGEK